ncbi:MAG: guanylate kinase, partial [Flavobacteriaceae bacterium]
SIELATAPQFDVIIKNYDLDVALLKAERLVEDYVNTPPTATE